MAKVIVTLNNQVQQEVALLKSRLTLGRRPGNDLVLDHLTVSGQHAAIDSAPGGSFILDLGSTNGTLVNGQPITKHLLQNDDLIDIGKYKIKFLLDPIADKETPVAVDAPVPAKMAKMEARIKVLSGSNAGKEMTLNKPVTRLGSPGVMVIAITRAQEYFDIAHVEGKAAPKLNNAVLDARPQRLQHGDVIDLSGTRMEFSYS